MKRDRVVLAGVAAAAGFSLLGLLTVQFVLVRRNLDWKSQAFRQNASGALASTVEKLEARDALKRIWTVSFLNKGEGAVALLAEGESRPTTIALKTGTVPKVAADGGDILLTLAAPQRVRIVVVEPLGTADRTVFDEVRPAGQSRLRFGRLLSGADGPKGTGWIKLFLDDVQYDLIPRDGRIVSVLVHPTIDQSRAALIDKVLEQYLVVHPAPIEERIDAADLRTAVEEALRERGIAAACVYGVIPAGRDEVILASDPGRRELLLRAEFRTRLFPHDITVAAGDLAFVFPEGEGSLLSRTGAPAVVAVLCILAAAACLYIVLRAAARAERAGEAMADFVANMTHEFKTPISTIALAADALGEAPVRASRERQDKYRGMIRSECGRMQDQVRKILETAALEKGELELKFARLDAHEAIRRTAEAFALAVESRGGSIRLRLEAGDADIEADPLHFPNVLRNLIDNAVKYARRPPDILVATATSGDLLRIAVTDNGPGLGPEARRRVFDKYYRVPSGNVHDVKGFGLGLSYARLVVKAHGGTIGVQSEEGRGSTFSVELPLRRKGTGNARPGSGR
jgi:signal transduction histidine kinase